MSAAHVISKHPKAQRRAIGTVCRILGLGGTVSLALRTAFDRTDDGDAFTFAGQDTLAAEAPMAVRALRNALQRAAAAGLVRTAVRRGEGFKHANAYTFNWPRFAEVLAGATDAGRPASEAAPGASSGEGSNRHQVPFEPAPGASSNRHVVPPKDTPEGHSSKDALSPAVAGAPRGGLVLVTRESAERPAPGDRSDQPALPLAAPAVTARAARPVPPPRCVAPPRAAKRTRPTATKPPLPFRALRACELVHAAAGGRFPRTEARDLGGGQAITLEKIVRDFPTEREWSDLGAYLAAGGYGYRTDLDVGWLAANARAMLAKARSWRASGGGPVTTPGKRPYVGPAPVGQVFDDPVANEAAKQALRDLADGGRSATAAAPAAYPARSQPAAAAACDPDEDPFADPLDVVLRAAGGSR